MIYFPGCSSKILGACLFISIILSPETLFAGEFNIKFGTGVANTFSRPDKLEEDVLVRPSFLLRMGYTIDDRLQFSLEGQYWPYWAYGVSIISVYRFPSILTAPSTRPYALVGLGWGGVAFLRQPANDDGSHDVSGWFQLHAGGGVDFSVFEWFDLGCELRLRMGFPGNPDVVSLVFFGTATFRFPLSIKLHKRE